MNRIGKKIVSKCIKYYHYVCPTLFDKELKRFYDENGKLKIVSHDDLNDTSFIVDVGGYCGNFTAEMYARYNCSITVFEPVPKFAQMMKSRFIKNKNIEIVNVGLGNCTKSISISIDGDSSSLFRGKRKQNKEDVYILDVVEWFDNNAINNVSLMSINIEGGEYSLLERLIDSGYIKKIDNVQVQFHDISGINALERMNKIGKELRKTHTLTFQYRFVWENWTLRR
jgi:FkbM family methyltransferase